MGEKRDEYVERLKDGIDRLNGEIDQLQARAERATEDVKGQYRDHVADLVVKRDAIKGRLVELKEASGTAWDDVKAGIDSAWEALGESVAAAKSRFK